MAESNLATAPVPQLCGVRINFDSGSTALTLLRNTLTPLHSNALGGHRLALGLFVESEFGACWIREDGKCP